MNGLNGELPTAPRGNTARTVFVPLDITESEALPWAYSPALADGGWILGIYKYPLAGSKTIPPELEARRTCLELNVVMLLPFEEELEVSDDVALVDVEEDDVSVEDDEDEVEVWFVLVAAMGDDVDATCLGENEM
jgi:hypothetical protein